MVLESFIRAKTITWEGKPILLAIHLVRQASSGGTRDSPTNRTNRSAGGLLSAGLSSAKSRMPDTMGLTKYMSKMEYMYTKWNTKASARKRVLGKRAILERCGRECADARRYALLKVADELDSQ